ncbi:hypothetical protein MUK42_10604 [Musa troglodytarum]|nr:hypothetical protein MUK42_10604 [Musa troglodytarum]
MAKPGAATRIIAPPVADPTVPSPGAHHTRLDPFYSSKRRVPNGADPIHNRYLCIALYLFLCHRLVISDVDLLPCCLA